ncbi:hypothetical protein KDA23_02145 [Candidatus Saccharibacteria bacterium]|nr:hypothetical protein [Candidatus Saccharibacteria bacterium]
MSQEAVDFRPTLKQREIIVGVASRIVKQTESLDEVRLVGFVEAAKLFFRGVPPSTLDTAVHEACREAGVEVQLYTPAKYNADVASPFGPRTVRVISREEEPVQDPLLARQFLGNAWQAHNVYPPADDTTEGVQ